MSIDKKIKYEEVPQLVKKTKGKKRKGYRGDAAAASGAAGHGGNTGGGTASGRGDGPATGAARDAQMGMQGKTGKATGVLGSVESSSINADLKAQQDANQRAQVRAGRVRDLEQFIDRPTLGFTDAAKYNLLSPKSIGTGLLSLATGIPFGLTNFFSNLSTRPSTNLTEDDIIGGSGGGGDGGNQIPIMGGIMSTVAPTVSPTVLPNQGITANIAEDPNRQAYYDQLYQQLIQGGINPTSAADIAQYRTSINFG